MNEHPERSPSLAFAISAAAAGIVGASLLVPTFLAWAGGLWW